MASRWKVLPSRTLLRRDAAFSPAAAPVAALAKAEILRLTNGIKDEAGRNSARRYQHRQWQQSQCAQHGRGQQQQQQSREGSDLAQLEGDLRKAITIFEDAIQRGLPVRDAETVSSLVKACCVPHAKWEAEQHQWALKLFEDSIGGVDGGLKSGDVSAKLVCDVDGCDAVAAYGSPFDGVQRRCRRHRGSEGDITCHVGLTFYALDMLGDSIVVCAPRHTHRLDSAAQLYAYYTRQAAATGHPLPLAALNRFFQACASRKQLPDAAIPLMEVVTSGGNRPVANAFIRMCARAEATDLAFRANDAALAAGLPMNAYTITSLVAACTGPGQLQRALDAVEAGREQGVSVDSDAHIVTALLKACALAQEPDIAQTVYERAVQAGMAPEQEVLNALAMAQAACGRMDATRAALLGPLVGDGVAGLLAPERSGRNRDTAVAALLHACINGGEPEQAIELFDSLAAAGYLPSTSGPHAALIEARSRVAEASPPATGNDEHGVAFRRLLKDAAGRGVAPDGRLVSTLISALARLGQPTDVIESFEWGLRQGVRPDVYALRGVLRACADLRDPAPLRRAMAAAADFGVDLKDASDLVVRAHLACVPVRRPHPSAASEHARASGLFDEAWAAYSRARERGWSCSPEACQVLLHRSALHDRVAESLEVLRHMQESDVRPQPHALNELMRASQRSGEIDDETLELWLSGSDDADEPADARSEAHLRTGAVPRG